MIFAGRPFLQSHPYLVIAPGMAVVVTGLALSLIGDGLARMLRREVR
jgi:ABC-type dipeptide/oligopeptide/nickel transport system permease subunit